MAVLALVIISNACSGVVSANTMCSIVPALKQGNIQMLLVEQQSA